MRWIHYRRAAATVLALGVVAGGVTAFAPAASALSCPSLGYSISTDGTNVYHTATPVKYYIDEAGQPFAGASDSIRAALATWSSDPFSTFRFEYAGTTTAKNVQDGISTISWRTPQQLKPPTSLTTAWTRLYGTGWTGNEFDIVFQTSGTIKWSNNIKAGTYDVQTIALHEAGHALGLNHVGCTNSIMIPNFTQQQVIRTPYSRDLAGLRYLYPIPVTPPPNRTGVVSYDQMRGGAPYNGYFVNAWQPFVAASNRITYLGVTVGNSALPAGVQVSPSLLMRLCTSPSCTTVLAERSPQIVNYGNTAVDIGDIAVTKGATYYVVWYQPAAAGGRTWVTYWWGGGPSISTSDVMQAVVRGFDA